MTAAELPLGRWGRVVAPEESAGVYVLVERETGEGWKKPPAADATSSVATTAGVEDDYDENWTTWLPWPDVVARFDRASGTYRVVEWLPEGVEPDSEQPSG